LLEPFLPYSSQKLIGWLGLNGNWRPRHVNEGLRLMDVSILFERLDKKVIEEEIERLGK